MEKDVIIALRQTIDYITDKFSVELNHISDLFLQDIVVELRERYSDVDFSYRFDSSSMRPDGGILSIVSKDNEKYPILITEIKNQGTNDLRAKEGLGGNRQKATRLSVWGKMLLVLGRLYCMNQYFHLSVLVTAAILHQTRLYWIEL